MADEVLHLLPVAQQQSSANGCDVCLFWLFRWAKTVGVTGFTFFSETLALCLHFGGTVSTCDESDHHSYHKDCRFDFHPFLHLHLRPQSPEPPELSLLHEELAASAACVAQEFPSGTVPPERHWAAIPGLSWMGNGRDPTSLAM